MYSIQTQFKIILQKLESMKVWEDKDSTIGEGLTEKSDSNTVCHHSAGPFPVILGKGPWLELGKNMRHFGNFLEA